MEPRFRLVRYLPMVGTFFETPAWSFSMGMKFLLGCWVFICWEKATGVGAGRLGHLHHTPRPSLEGVAGN
jgi:hypothetical protein